MRCPNCKEVTSDDYRFCLQCGTDLGETTIVSQQLAATPGLTRQFESRPKNKDRTKVLWISMGFLCGGVLVAALIGFYFFAKSSLTQAVSVEPTIVEKQTPQSPLAATMSPTPGPTVKMAPSLPLAATKDPTLVPTAPLERPTESVVPTVEATGVIYSAVQVSQKAQVISKPEPQYTEEARKNQVTGTVILRAVFNSTGQVTNISARAGLPYGLTERAIAAARQIKFTPATKDGRPVSMYIQLEYNFSLY